ncbi:MAG: alpha/beta hydrolase [Gemmobacter sp.]|nr:alpha/beta hydrolase [Gemmobacter sp.]
MPIKAGQTASPDPMMQPRLTVTYAEQPTRKGLRALQADLYRPDGGGTFPLVVWMHSGGFRSGSREHPVHARMAAEFARHGYATAFLDYRLARPFAVLRPSVEACVEPLIAEAKAAGEEMHETFIGPRPLAVVEDCCAFLTFAAAQAADWGLSGRILLGGSSAGAISALNTLYLPAHLGLSRPPVATVFAFSGGFAYTPRLAASGARILALHNPSDDRVPVSSIRRLALHCPDPCLLIESDMQDHGGLCLDPDEPLSAGIDRCIAFDQAADPLSICVD